MNGAAWVGAVSFVIGYLLANNYSQLGWSVVAFLTSVAAWVLATSATEKRGLAAMAVGSSVFAAIVLLLPGPNYQVIAASVVMNGVTPLLYHIVVKPLIQKKRRAQRE